MPKPCLRDIAKIANVSCSTVSIVLNGKEKAQSISKSTTARVMKLIEESGYEKSSKLWRLKKELALYSNWLSYSPYTLTSDGKIRHRGNCKEISAEDLAKEYIGVVKNNESFYKPLLKA